MSSYKVIRKLATGGTAEVYIVQCLETGEIAIAKVPYPKYAELIEKEIVILKHIRSLKGVPRLIDRKWDYEIGVPVLILEYIQGAKLHDVYFNTCSQVLRFFVNLIDTVESIHNLGVVHRDLTPEHIMITDRDQIKLIDFSIAEFVHSTKGIKAYHGRYTAPEVKRGNISYSNDVWSLGIILEDLARKYELSIDTHYLNNRVIVADQYKRASLKELREYICNSMR